MKKTTELPQKTGYLAPEAIQFRVEPVKCFATSPGLKDSNSEDDVWDD